jgi:hypothetical protein
MYLLLLPVLMMYPLQSLLFLPVLILNLLAYTAWVDLLKMNQR